MLTKRAQFPSEIGSNKTYKKVIFFVKGEKNMEIGNKILELRKSTGLSQEELAEKVGVSRQTISKWELGETSPDIKQAKELSKIFNISIDELVNNDRKDIIIEKVSNTEKLAGIIIKILKFLGIAFIVFFVIEIIAFILFAFVKSEPITQVGNEIEFTCTLNDESYLISVGSDGYFNCSNCPKELQIELKDNYVDFGDINKSFENITEYFSSKSGDCE